MKVAHIVSSLTTGGAEKLVAEISILMKKKNIDIKIISILNIRGVPYEIINRENIELIELNYRNKVNPKIAIDVYNYTKDCDIVHTHTYYAQLYASVLISKRKLITTEHSTFNNRRGKFIFKILDYLMYCKYSKIICISEATKKSINNWISSTSTKSIVVSNGINLEKYYNSVPISRSELGIYGDKIILICIGRFSKAKNHINLIKAFSKIRNDDVILLLAGGGDLENDIKRLVASLSLTDRVTFLGQRNDIEKVLKASDIFILPSLWEGFGLGAIEAIAAGIPSILSNVDGIRDITKLSSNAIVYVNPNDHHDITEKINFVLDNIDDFKYKAKNQISLLSRYSIVKTADNYLNIYDEMKR